MKYHKQRCLHKPEEGQMGDCFRTVLACLLDLGTKEVPHFMQVPESVPTSEIWKEVDRWLSDEFGLRYVGFPFQVDDLDGYLARMAAWWPGLRFELSGASPRGTTHSVIAQDGAIIHDPHPEGGGIVGPDEQTGHYFMGFLLPVEIHGVRPIRKEST